MDEKANLPGVSIWGSVTSPVVCGFVCFCVWMCTYMCGYVCMYEKPEVTCRCSLEAIHLVLTEKEREKERGRGRESGLEWVGASVHVEARGQCQFFLEPYLVFY